MTSAGGKTSVALTTHHRGSLYKTTIISKLYAAQLNSGMKVIFSGYKKPAQQNLYYAFTILVNLLIESFIC